MLLSVLTLVLLLIALVTGAMATTAATLTVEAIELWGRMAMLHRSLAAGSSALAIGLLAWMAVRTAGVRKLALLVLVALVIVGSLGEIPNGVVGWGGVTHALLAQISIAGALGLVTMHSSGWTSEQPSVQDYGWPSLRSLAFTLPTLVGLQVLLGVMFRQRMLGLMPHIMGALLVTMFILMVAAFVLQQCKDHGVLKSWARALMVVTVLQLFLGIGAYTVRALPNQSPNLVLAVAAGHVATGALVLAVSSVLGMNIRRHVTPKLK